jgi:hypothetical protein
MKTISIIVVKNHSIKNNLLCIRNLWIVRLNSTYKGHVYDKKICDKEPLLLPKGIRLWEGTDFTGHRPEDVEVCIPKKKPKRKNLELRRISGFPELRLK